MIHSLSDWNPLSVKYYKWCYSLDELKELFKQKSADYVEKKKVDFDFLVQLATAALGGKQKDTFGEDTGEGVHERTEEQDAAMRAMLGEDYDRVVGS